MGFFTMLETKRNGISFTDLIYPFKNYLLEVIRNVEGHRIHRPHEYVGMLVLNHLL